LKAGRVKIIAFRTRLWRPGTNYLNLIAGRVEGRIKDRDLLVVSEKPLSTAMGFLFDEARINPGLLARGIARFWMKTIWGRILGPFTGMNDRNLERLRGYPVMEGARHKELALMLKGFIAALKPWSEGGLDASNLPYAYCAAPLPDPERVAQEIQDFLRRRLRVDAPVMIVDSDKTYLLGNIGLSTRDSTVPGIINLGFVSFILGRRLGLRAYATPIAYTGGPLSLKGLLRVASLADRAMGSGAGNTVWDMAENFNTGLTEVSWDMLSRIPHRPLAVVRGMF